ncbi:MAG: hypothetical protein ACRDLB_16300 [Actinomycetota bacterium]
MIWGLLAAHPFGGMTWQVLHYLVGLRRMGFDVWYVEDRINEVIPTDPWDQEYRFDLNVEFAARRLSDVGLQDRWMIRDPVETSIYYGSTEQELARLYETADMTLNVTGSYVMDSSQHDLKGLIYIETDPVLNQIWIAQGVQWIIDELAAYDVLFTYGENIGSPDCLVPVERFTWQTTRPPVIIDWWAGHSVETPRITTVASWTQAEKDIEWEGEVYRWSKYEEFLRFIDLPSRSPLPLELCLTKISTEDTAKLESRGWEITSAADVWDPELYRAYVAGSLGEFTVAKDQYVRFNTGWFSDRSACYLAAGRPVVTQDTGFPRYIESGQGLLPFSTVDEASGALASVADAYESHSGAATEIAAEYFSHERVLEDMLQKAGLA